MAGERENLRSYLKGRNCTGVEHGYVRYANGESEPLYKLRSKHKLPSEGEVETIAKSVAGSARGM